MCVYFLKKTTMQMVFILNSIGHVMRALIDYITYNVF